jgi:hypothetical protein
MTLSTPHNHTQYNETQHNDTQNNDTEIKMATSITTLSSKETLSNQNNDTRLNVCFLQSGTLLFMLSVIVI